MKRKILIIALLLTVVLSTSAQDAKEILKSSYAKCQSVQNGYYEMTKFMKYLSDKDTIAGSFYCHFQKLKNDSLFSSAFHYKQYPKGEYTGDVLYTGDAFISTNAKDSTATIMSNALWAKEIKQFSHNNTFYSPLTNKKSSPLPNDSDYIDHLHSFKYNGEEILNNVSCFHIQVNTTPENDSKEMMKTLRIEFHFWISKSDSIPIQYSIAYDLVMNNDTMYQYEKICLNKYEINNLKNQSILTLNSVPACYTMKDYVPYKRPMPLPKDTVAPNWKLLSLTGEEINLTDLKGKVVLLDFFYKSCYPCLQALPDLQSLNEKYKNQGLRIIGIDPYDKKEDDLAAFLAKRGITYTVLLGGKDVVKDYRVSGYPTMYLIDKDGKVIFNQVGYGNDTEQRLEKIIRKNL